jgi:hypothetical protein
MITPSDLLPRSLRHGVRRVLSTVRHKGPPPHVIALLATYNEARVIEECLRTLIAQEIDVYLLDNQSTDGTLDIARRFLGAGLVGFETLPRDGTYRWRDILMRKEMLAATLDADWFMHVDADELRPSPWPGISLARALGRVDEAGFNAVDFQEFTFVPTQEAPDHDHPRFADTMRWYYPFRNMEPHLVRAWKRQSSRVSLAASGGHEVVFSQRRIFPVRFPMRHYQFLSLDQLTHKYAPRNYSPEEVAAGWHGWRPRIGSGRIFLPREGMLQRYRSDEQLDSSDLWTRHWVDLQLSASAALTVPSIET